MPRMLLESFTNIHYCCTSTPKVIPFFSISAFLETLRCLLGMKLENRHAKGIKKAPKMVSVWFLQRPRAVHPCADVGTWAGTSPKVVNGVGWNLPDKWFTGWRMQGRVSQNMLYTCDKYSWSFGLKSWKMLKYSRMPSSQWKISTAVSQGYKRPITASFLLLSFGGF